MFLLVSIFGLMSCLFCINEGSFVARVKISWFNLFLHVWNGYLILSAHIFLCGRGFLIKQFRHKQLNSFALLLSLILLLYIIRHTVNLFMVRLNLLILLYLFFLIQILFRFIDLIKGLHPSLLRLLFLLIFLILFIYSFISHLFILLIYLLLDQSEDILSLSIWRKSLNLCQSGLSQITLIIFLTEHSLVMQ